MPLEIAQAIQDARLDDLRVKLATALPAASRQLPFTLEIGSGHGHFLTGYAEANRDKFCLGIDIIQDRLDRSERKSRRAGLTNIAWLRAEASLFLSALAGSPDLPPLNEIFLLFSDPWPKRRHWKNRVLQPEFLTTLAARAGKGARFFFRTDHAPYFSQAHDFIVQHPDWVLCTEEPWPFELVTVFQQRAEAGYQSLIARRA